MVRRDVGNHRKTPRTTKTSRRTALKVLGAAGVTGLAGCSQQSGSTETATETATETSGSTPTSGGSGGASTGTARPKSDIEGQEVHFIKGRTNQATVQLFDEVAREFKNETGAILNAEYSGMGTGRWQRMIQLLQAGDPPEVGVSELSNAISLWGQGLLEPVTGVMERLNDQYGAPPDSTRYIADGEEWMVPWSIGFADFWYRGDLVEEVGLGSDFAPDTWENLRTYARAITENTDMDGMFVPASESDPTQAMLISFLRSNNGQITEYRNGDWQVAFTQGQHRTRMAETLEFLNEIHDNYSPDAGGATWDSLQQCIAFEVAASTWFGGTRPKNEVGRHQQSASFAADVVNVGHNPANRSTKGRANVGPMIVFKDSENPEAGKQFLEFLMGNEEYAARLCWADAPVHCQPPFPGIKDSDFYQNLLDSLPDHWTQETLDRHNFEATKHGVTSAFETDPANPYMGTLQTSLVLPAMAQDVFLNDRSVDDAIDDYGAQLADQLERAKQQSS